MKKITDKMRLDWLGEAIAVNRIKGPPHHWVFEVGFVVPRKKIPWRQAIDAAIRAEAGRIGAATFISKCAR